jgi:hypothetical protein
MGGGDRGRVINAVGQGISRSAVVNLTTPAGFRRIFSCRGPASRKRTSMSPRFLAKSKYLNEANLEGETIIPLYIITLQHHISHKIH